MPFRWVKIKIFHKSTSSMSYRNATQLSCSWKNSTLPQFFHALSEFLCSYTFVHCHNYTSHRSTIKYTDCLSKKRIMLDQIESKLDTGLDRSINALIGWIKVYLQAEQKKSDFRPDTDVDTVASPACLNVVQNIMPVIVQMKRCMDGENLVAIMKDFGVRFHRVILEHFQQFQFNTAGEWSRKNENCSALNMTDFSGAMCAICDVNEYRKCVRVLNSPLVIQLFDILHALCNLLLVKHENLPEVCGGETLVRFDCFLNSQFQVESSFCSLSVILELSRQISRFEFHSATQ